MSQTPQNCGMTAVDWSASSPKTAEAWAFLVGRRVRIAAMAGPVKGKIMFTSVLAVWGGDEDPGVIIVSLARSTLHLGSLDPAVSSPGQPWIVTHFDGEADHGK